MTEHSIYFWKLLRETWLLISEERKNLLSACVYKSEYSKEKFSFALWKEMTLRRGRRGCEKDEAEQAARAWFLLAEDLSGSGKLEECKLAAIMGQNWVYISKGKFSDVE